jgi:hypothetical protein
MTVDTHWILEPGHLERVSMERVSSTINAPATSGCGLHVAQFTFQWPPLRDSYQ